MKLHDEIAGSTPQSNNFALYRGKVVDNKDPEKLGRVRVRVPEVHGVPGGYSYTPDEQLLWAVPALGMNITLNSGLLAIPEVGTIVFVLFESGNFSKPVYLGTVPYAKNTSFSNDGQVHPLDDWYGATVGPIVAKYNGITVKSVSGVTVVDIEPIHLEGRNYLSSLEVYEIKRGYRCVLIYNGVSYYSCMSSSDASSVYLLFYANNGSLFATVKVSLITYKVTTTYI